MSRRQFVFLVSLVAVIVSCIAIAPIVRRLVVQENTPQFFEAVHGIDQKGFENFTRLYGVRSEEVSSFGSMEFPVNYIRWKVDWDTNRDKGLSLASVEAEIKGPLALCKVGVNTWWYYFYTLERDNGREPFVMGLSLRGQTVTNIYPVALGDSGQEGGLALGCLADPKKLVKFVQ